MVSLKLFTFAPHIFNEPKMQKKTFIKKISLPLSIVCVLVFGILIGLRISKSNLHQQYLTIQRWNKLNAVLSIVTNKYVDTIYNTELEEQTIEQALKTLDPHSVYISASKMGGANEEINGKFEGIGIMFSVISDTIVISSVIHGGPSEKAGLWYGDKIITINDSVYAGRKIPQDSIVRRLRGKSGTNVNVGVLRSDVSTLIPFTITRGSIPLKSVDAAYLLNPKVGFIKLNKFSRTTYEETVEAIEHLQDAGMQKLVLDLRSNGGGLLDQALDVLSEFFEKGTLLVYTEGRASPRRNYTARGGGVLRNMPVVVLIDENSASASEIVAGAIQDNDRGEIIGRRSFGKGLVQEAIDFSDGSGLRLTTARYYTPIGRCIQRPYDKGEDEYHQEFWRRLEHGEFVSSDSILQNKDLLYTTPSGKIVYGGGGITPDIFVPMDTTGMNEYYMSVWRKNLVYKFAMQFSDTYRKDLQELKTLVQIKRYLYYRNFVPAFAKYAAGQGIDANPQQLQACARLLNAQIKALIGRSTPMGDTGYYVFLNIIDKNVQTAIKTLEYK
jgi:carboxyl-terminal processing protease